MKFMDYHTELWLPGLGRRESGKLLPNGESSGALLYNSVNILNITELYTTKELRW